MVADRLEIGSPVYYKGVPAFIENINGVFADVRLSPFKAIREKGVNGDSVVHPTKKILLTQLKPMTKHTHLEVTQGLAGIKSLYL